MLSKITLKFIFWVVYLSLRFYDKFSNNSLFLNINLISERNQVTLSFLETSFLTETIISGGNYLKIYCNRMHSYFSKISVFFIICMYFIIIYDVIIE